MALAAFVLILSACGGVSPPKPVYDLVFRGGTIYDGGGGQPFVGDLAIRGDVIVAIGDLGSTTGKEEIDVGGLAVAPGFVNMMCWANESLIEDGRSQSDLRQGVTLEIMGEGESMGPLNETMKGELLQRQGDIRYEVEVLNVAEPARPPPIPTQALKLEATDD